jgi:hypothetical protein
MRQRCVVGMLCCAIGLAACAWPAIQPLATVGPTGSPQSTSSAVLPRETATAVPPSAVPTLPSTRTTEPPTPVPTTGVAAGCTAAQLTVSSTNSAVAAGSVGGYLRFLNTGQQRCSLHGWPGVEGVLADGTAIKARETASVLTFPAASSPPVVTLEPGESAFAAYAGTDTTATGATCPSYAALGVRAPGTNVTVSLSSDNPWYGHELPACGPIDVTMVVSASSVPFLEPLRP